MAFIQASSAATKKQNCVTYGKEDDCMATPPYQGSSRSFSIGSKFGVKTLIKNIVMIVVVGD